MKTLMMTTKITEHDPEKKWLDHYLQFINIHGIRKIYIYPRTKSENSKVNKRTVDLLRRLVPSWNLAGKTRRELHTFLLEEVRGAGYEIIEWSPDLPEED